MTMPANTMADVFLNAYSKLTHRDSNTTQHVGTPVIPLVRRGN